MAAETNFSFSEPTLLYRFLGKKQKQKTEIHWFVFYLLLLIATSSEKVTLLIFLLRIF